MEANNPENQNQPETKNNNSSQIAAAILVAGVLIAGAVLLKNSTPPTKEASNPSGALAEIKPVNPVEDRVLGNKDAKVTVVMYEDFKCSWCVKFNNESEKYIKDNYINTGKVALIYRDFPFLSDESFRAALAGYCAHDQGKFWEFHDLIFTNQGSAEKTSLADANLKAFAKTAGLNPLEFDKCLDSDKHAEKILASKTEAQSIGVRGTPHGFILKDGKVVDVIQGYMPADKVAAKIDQALK